MTDVEDHRISSTVTVKRIHRATIEQLNNITKSNETENVNTISTKHNDNSRITQYSTVTVLRVPKLNEVNQSNSITPQQKTLSASSVKSSKINQVKIIKIPRNQSAIYQRTRAISLDNISTIDLNKHLIALQPTTNAKTASLSTNINAHKGNRVTVTKLLRQCTNLQSRPS
ncbi:unnamed protein product [Rotaria sp. Silwood1]|nr:unnamed protein product [Rotaria sp. Silwood1]CAF1512259.1 unnamed protein product [Rotaria sp. Silwood1]CAF3689572.1 unnamed protein product [Rotaria sp. Silwood1]